MKKFFAKRWVKYPFFTLVFAFAIVGFFLSATYFAVQFKLTNDAGSIDMNDRYFNEIKDKYNQSFKMDTTNGEIRTYKNLERLLILNKYCPKNANFIMDAYMEDKNEVETSKMIDAVELFLQKNKAYQKEIQQLNKQKKQPNRLQGSIFDWMNR